jgi:hypothetical protein
VSSNAPWKQYKILVLEKIHIFNKAVAWIENFFESKKRRRRSWKKWKTFKCVSHAET